MEKQTIRVGANEYPAYQTMGAIVAFKRETGKDIQAITPGDIVEMLKYLFCVVRSACRRDEIEFPFADVETFADGIALEDFTAWANGVNQSNQEQTTDADTAGNVNAGKPQK